MNIDNLEAAMARGVLSARVNGEQVDYANGDELRARLAYFRQQLREAQTGTAAGVSVHYPSTGRGL